MGVDEQFEQVRTALRAEERALVAELERIDAEARAAVEASVAHVRAELATQADRIREAIAQQREEVEALADERRDDVEDDGGAGEGAGTVEDDVDQVTPGGDDPQETIGDVERGD